MVGQTAIVVVYAQIGAANFANAQFLLLVTAGRHRITVFLLKTDNRQWDSMMHPMINKPLSISVNSLSTSVNPLSLLLSLLTSASCFCLRISSTFSINFKDSSTFPSSPNCSASAKVLPMVSFNSKTLVACEKNFLVYLKFSWTKKI